MPPHTRSQRRRQSARQQPHQRAEQTDIVNDVVASGDEDIATLTSIAVPSALSSVAVPPVVAPLQAVPVSAVARTEAARTATTRRSSSTAATNATGSTRRRARPELAPVDYTSDYRSVRHDLRWIAIWTALLFVGMIALRLSGIAL